MALYIVLGVLVLLVVGFIGIYNRLVGLKNQADESFSGIDVQLKRRYDLIPNLVETVKGYASHEKDTLEKVIRARNSAMGATDPNAKVEAENMLSGALKTVFALSESYPDLKANASFLELQRELSGVEENLQQARRYYNAVARDLNTASETFPNVFVARMMGMQNRSYFEAQAGERENVKVSFSAP